MPFNRKTAGYVVAAALLGSTVTFFTMHTVMQHQFESEEMKDITLLQQPQDCDVSELRLAINISNQLCLPKKIANRKSIQN